MKKLIFILLVLVLSIVGCQEEKEISSPDIENLNSEIVSLKNQLQQDSSNKKLSYELGKKMFDLDLAYAKAKNVRPGNEPFLLENPANDECVVLAHGFTASAWEIKELSEYLFDKDINVYGVLLAGHGTKKEDLKETKWEDWSKSVEDGYNTLKYICNEVFVGGVSTGGSLSLHFSQNNDVAGIISLSSPVFMGNKMAKTAFFVKYFKKYFYNENLDDEERKYYYSNRPTAAIQQLVEFLKMYRKDMNKITEPIIIMQSYEDEVVDPISASFIHENIASKQKELIMFDGDRHVITTGDDKEEVFEKVYEFINKNS